MSESDAQIPLIGVVGPTASGKTALGIALALALEGEIVNADSRQIYREMDIGTAKPTLAERALVPHHLLDVVAPNESFTLADYQQRAMLAIADIHARGKRPILVGGTGLYIRAVVDGLTIPAVAPDLARRAALEAVAAREGAAALHARLAASDPEAAVKIPAANVRRVIRALEVIAATGAPFSAQQQRRAPPYALTMFGLNTERARLYTWADARVEAMLAAGFVAEVERLVVRGYGWDLPAMSGLGYRQLGAYLRGDMTLPDAVQRLKFDTHGFIRKQLVWFRPDTRIHWLAAAAPNLAADALEMLSQGAGG